MAGKYGSKSNGKLVRKSNSDTESMEIQLNGKNGGVAIVDKEDYDMLNKYSWCKLDGYVVTKINGKNVRMHRLIAKANKSLKVDHINQIKHDNRKSNLRITTSLGNGQNKKIYKNKKSSSFKGVFYNNNSNKYRVRITINYKIINLGSFDNEIKAAEIYDTFIVQNNYEYFPLNFPEKKDEYLKRKRIEPISNKKKKYKGVQKRNNKYAAIIQINKKIIYIHSSKNPIECAKAYDKYIIDKNIPNKKLNFPNDYPEYEIIKRHYEILDNNDNIVKLLINNSLNKTILIDKEDYDKIKCYAWYVDNNNKDYVCANANNKNIKLHRFVTNTTDPDIWVDHIDSNTLNNTKKNLRISNFKKNPQNRIKTENSSSKYIGVFLNKCAKKWLSNITFDGIVINLGMYDNEIYAARRRDLYILENFKEEHFKLNFEWNENDILHWKNELPINKQSAYHYKKQVKRYTELILESMLNNDLERAELFDKIFNIRKKERVREIKEN